MKKLLTRKCPTGAFEDSVERVCCHEALAPEKDSKKCHVPWVRMYVGRYGRRAVISATPHGYQAFVQPTSRRLKPHFIFYGVVSGIRGVIP